MCCEGLPTSFNILDRSAPMRIKYGNTRNRCWDGMADLPAKVEVGWRQTGAGRPCGSAGPQVPPLVPPFVLDTARWAPNLCMSVPGLCSSVFYVKWASFGCVTQQQCFVYLCCVLCLFSPYFEYGCLQTKNHQNS